MNDMNENQVAAADGSGTSGYLTETFIVGRIRDFLTNNENGGNWHAEKTKQAGLHQRGVDLRLTGGSKNGERFFIECKKQSKEKENWLNALAQLVTRIKVSTNLGGNRFCLPGSYKYGLGLHKDMARIALYRISKAAAQILNLYIFSVDDDGFVKKWTPSTFGQRYKIKEFSDSRDGNDPA